MALVPKNGMLFVIYVGENKKQKGGDQLWHWFVGLLPVN